MAGAPSAGHSGLGTVATAVRLAAGWLQEGTREAVALTVAARLSWPAQSSTTEESVDILVDGAWGMTWLRRSATAAAALAVAVQQQPHGTFEARELAVAAGRALLQERRGTALGVAARQMGPDSAAPLAAVAGRVLRLATGGGGRTLLPVDTDRVHLRRRRQQPWRCGRRTAGSSVDPAGLDTTVLCHDAVARVIEALWPPLPAPVPRLEATRSASTSLLSPRTFETRLRSAARVLRNLQQVSAVSPAMARHASHGGWPATHAYLYQEAGTKGELRHRYAASVQRLLVRDRLLRAGGGEEGLVARVLGFLGG